MPIGLGIDIKVTVTVMEAETVRLNRLGIFYLYYIFVILSNTLILK